MFSVIVAVGATLLSQPFVEPLVAFEVSSVAFMAPSEWVLQKNERAARFDTPEGDAFIHVDIVELNPFESARECLEEMINKEERQGWERISVDKYPAARWVATRPGDAEAMPSAEEAERLALGKEVDTRVTDIWILGCNGARRWILRMGAKTRDAAKYGPTFRRVRESFQYKVHATLSTRAPAKKK